MALASASGIERIATSTSKLSAMRPFAVRLPVPKLSSSGVRSIAPSCTVTVAGAARVAAIPGWRSDRVESVAAKPPSTRASSPEASASVPIASRPSAVKRIRSRSSCSASADSAAIPTPPSTRSAPVERAIDHRQSERVVDPGVGVERADAVPPT